MVLPVRLLGSLGWARRAAIVALSATFVSAAWADEKPVAKTAARTKSAQVARTPANNRTANKSAGKKATNTPTKAPSVNATVTAPSAPKSPSAPNKSTGKARGGSAHAAHRPSPYLEIPPEEEAMASAAYRYANMNNEEAFAELDRRGIAYHVVPAVGTVRAPIRLDGRLQGVDFHGSLPEAERETSMFEILDARFALTLDDFATILARHDVVEVVHYTMYRPNVAAPSTGTGATPATDKGGAKTPLDKAAARSQKGAAKPTPSQGLGRKGTVVRKAPAPPTGQDRKKSPSEGLTPLEAKHPAVEVSPEFAKGKAVPAPTKSRGKSAKTRVLAKEAELSHAKWAPPGTRHPAGLAIDVGILRRRDGSTLNVAQHFQGHVGDKTCGEDAPTPQNADAQELRAIVCEARESGVFTYALTPNFNVDHFDHFHMEIKPAVRWFLYH